MPSEPLLILDYERVDPPKGLRGRIRAVRACINRHPQLVITIAGLAILLSLLYVIGPEVMVTILNPPRPPVPHYFSRDGGKTWFAVDAKQGVPMPDNGRTAYRCHLYTCDGGRTLFVGWLERNTPQAKQALQEIDRVIQAVRQAGKLP